MTKTATHGHTLAIPRTEKTTDCWLTPKFIIDALGPSSLDPCHNSERPFETAAHYFTESDDGLAQSWSGYGAVFCNPPYGAATGMWLRKMAQHNNGIALVFAKTETAAFQIAWRNASAILFLDKRIQFLRSDGKLPDKPGSGAGSALIAFGDECATRLRSGGLSGHLVTGKEEVGTRSLFDKTDNKSPPTLAETAAFPILLFYDADDAAYTDAKGDKWKPHEMEANCVYCHDFLEVGWQRERDKAKACADCVTP